MRMAVYTMTHFGIICPSSAGHLNPMTTLGHELKQRGHRVTLFGLLDAQFQTLAAGLDFCALGEILYPHGSVARELKHLGEMSEIDALLHTIHLSTKGVNFNLQELPGSVKATNVEVLLIDQSTFEGGTIAEFLKIPFITICNALVLNPDIGVPPPIIPPFIPTLNSWNYDSSWWGYLRNLVGYAELGLLGISLINAINKYRQQWNLPTYISVYDELWSKLAQISQQPIEFEFPRKSLPYCFHFTGPWSNSACRKPIAFPYEKLTGQPLIYASFGTVQNRLMWLFHSIAEACVGINAQLVISLGSSENTESLPNLPGKPLIVKYAPQLELLERASLTITHAGMNTTLESLSNGVPMVAIPITNDQPGVAARIAWTGAGEVVPLSDLSIPKLRSAIKRVLTEDSYRQNAFRLQEAIRRSGGVSRAADIVEQVIAMGKPVY